MGICHLHHQKANTILYIITNCLNKSLSVLTHFRSVSAEVGSSPSRMKPGSYRRGSGGFRSYVSLCRANFLSDSLEEGGELKDGCMTGCHSALNPTSVPSLCISITRARRHRPAPVDPLGELLSAPPCPALPSPFPSRPLPSLRLSAFLISPLPARPSLVLHSGCAPHLHCGCQSEGRREEWRLCSV